jgi:hypothetical protein
MEGNIIVEKIPPRKSKPILLHFHDSISDSQDEILTPGGGGKIIGTLLKYDNTDPLQGIFFVNVGNAATIQITGKLLRNKPGELIFIIPADIPAGLYRVEVRTLIKDTKAVRTGALPYNLTVS